MKNSLEMVRQTIEKYNLIEKNEKVLVAFSGGYDSLCLALCLKELGYTIGLAHVNHGLRKSAKRDADFCKAFAMQHNLPFYYKEENVCALAETEKISAETAGRNVRYAFFESIAGYDKIATGHHKNDCAETVLQHLIRGTGLKGLGGIAPKRGKIIRPLINLTRAEIEAFVNEKGVVPCDDETNQSLEYERNRVRLEILPAMQKENSRVVDNLCRTAELLRQDEDLLRNLASEYVSENSIDISLLQSLHPALAVRALRLAYAHTAGTEKDLEQKHIAYILENLKPHGDIIDLCFDVVCTAQYGKLLFIKKQQDDVSYCFAVESDSTVHIPQIGRTFRLFTSDKPESNHYFCMNSLENKQLFIRSPKETDKFYPFGAEGGKALNKVLIDLKIPKDKRKALPLLTTNDEVLSIIGIKRSRFYPTNAQTIKYLNVQEEPTQ